VTYACSRTKETNRKWDKKNGSDRGGAGRGKRAPSQQKTWEQRERGMSEILGLQTIQARFVKGTLTHDLPRFDLPCCSAHPTSSLPCHDVREVLSNIGDGLSVTQCRTLYRLLWAERTDIRECCFCCYCCSVSRIFAIVFGIFFVDVRIRREFLASADARSSKGRKREGKLI
jgi:hypothetical protein